MIETSSLLAAITIASSLTFGVLAVDARLSKSRARLNELEAASVALKAHYRALERLDDPDTPVIVLERALLMSELIHDRHFAQVITEMLRADPGAFTEERNSSFDDDEFFESLKHTRMKRPDLAAEFHNAYFTGIAAFVLRWPECSGAFPSILITVATEPTEDAVRALESVANLSKRPAFPFRPPTDGPMAVPV